jgi:two-component system response regulator AtoC
VGDDREVPVDVRVVAATNHDLRAMVDEGRFRADLYHRLGVLVTTVPALVERTGDVPLLIDHFLLKYQALRPCRASASAAFVAALEGLRLPGNVRQLQNLVRHALVKRSDDTPLGLEDLPAEALRQLSIDLPPDGDRPAVPAEWVPILESHGWNLARSLSACERMLVRAALDRARGNQSETARLLGVTARSVYNKIRKHDLH